jgi:hypothetical protein
MADNIKVNAGQWQGLSKDDQDRVRKILASTGLLKEGASITPDAAAPQAAAIPAGGAQPQGLGTPFCKIACDLAEAGAVALCTATGPGLPVCLALAHAGGELCRSRC